MNKRKIGALYEQIASEYLKSMGYEMIQANYRCPSGEIDLIARDGAYLVFVEVKYRRSLRTGSPLEAVGVKKQQTIRRAAQWYLTENHLDDVPVRFDVAGILGEEITVIKNAF